MARTPIAITTDPKWHARSDPRYHAAQARIDDLAGKLRDVERQIQDAHNVIGQARADMRQLKAEALANGLPEPTPPPVPNMASLYEQQDILQRAIKVAELNHRKVAGIISEELIVTLRPQYVEVIKRVHAAALELAAATQAEEDFIHGLRIGDTRLGPTMPRVTIGQDSTVAAHILDNVAEDANRGYRLNLPTKV